MSVSATGNGTGSEREAKTEWVEAKFGDERLPYEEGWVRPVEQLTVAGILGLTAEILEVS